MNSIFKISEEIKSKVDFCSIITIIAKVEYQKYSSAVIEKLNYRVRELSAKYSKDEIRKIPQIMKTREAMSKLGRDPNRYLNSVEALVKRTVTKYSIYQINNIVDFNNYLSLKYFVPVGSYDFNNISGDIILRIGTNSEEYQSLSKDDFNLENVPLLADRKGPFGSIISDSKRTLITPDTQQIFSVMFFFDGKKEEILKISEEVEQLYMNLLNVKEIKTTYHE